MSEDEIQNRCEIAASTVYGIARMGAHQKIPRVVSASPRELVDAALRTLIAGWGICPNQPIHRADADD